MSAVVLEKTQKVFGTHVVIIDHSDCGESVLLRIIESFARLS